MSCLSKVSASQCPVCRTSFTTVQMTDNRIITRMMDTTSDKCSKCNKMVVRYFLLGNLLLNIPGMMNWWRFWGCSTRKEWSIYSQPSLCWAAWGTGRPTSHFIYIFFHLLKVVLSSLKNHRKVCSSLSTGSKQPQTYHPVAPVVAATSQPAQRYYSILKL